MPLPLVLPLMPVSNGEEGDQYFILQTHDGTPISNRKYRASTGGGIIEGFTDAQGKTKILEGFIGQTARFELLDDEYDEHFILKDPLGKPMSNVRFKIKSASGQTVDGVTDDAGRTNLFTSDKIEEIELFHIEEEFPESGGVE